MNALSYRGPDNKLIFIKLINKQNTRKEGIIGIVACIHIILYANVQRVFNDIRLEIQ